MELTLSGGGNLIHMFMYVLYNSLHAPLCALDYVSVCLCACLHVCVFVCTCTIISFISTDSSTLALVSCCTQRFIANYQVQTLCVSIRSKKYNLLLASQIKIYKHTQCQRDIQTEMQHTQKHNHTPQVYKTFLPFSPLRM